MCGPKMCAIILSTGVSSTEKDPSIRWPPDSIGLEPSLRRRNVFLPLFSRQALKPRVNITFL
jgi:hypothetical protein